MKNPELEEEKEKFEKLFHNGPEPMVLMDNEERVLDINSRFKEVFGFVLDEIKGKKINDVVVPDRFEEEGKELDKKSGQGYVNYETIRKGKEGEFHVSISATPVTINDKTYKIGTYRDIEKRKIAERKFETLFENSPVVIWVQDFSEVKKYLDGLKNEVDDLERYFDENPKEIDNCMDKMEIINVNETALGYYEAETKEELMSNLDKIFTEKAREPLKKQFLSIANGETYFKSVEEIRTLKGEKKNVIFEIKIPEENKKDYSRGYVTATDITERKKLEKKLKEREKELEERVEESEETIKELSTPVINVWDNIIAMPLVGVIDTMRAEQITENLLEAIKETEAEVAILDVSGVPVIDTEVADRLIRTVKAASLLGTESIIVGIRPDIAESMVHLGVDLSGIETHSSLQTGLEVALNKIEKKVVDNE